MVDRIGTRYVKQCWDKYPLFRVILILTAVWALVRLAAQLFLLIDYQYPDDLRIYLEAAQAFQARQGLYPSFPLKDMASYLYAPAFAVASVPFTWMSRYTAAVVDTLLHCVVYGWLYVSWDRIFSRYAFEKGREMLAWTLPMWLIFSLFWADQAYLNIYVFVGLLATLLFEAILTEKLGWAVFWLAIILQIKPMWAFGAVMPLLLGRYKFFFKLIALSVLVYGLVVGLVVALSGVYGWDQYQTYFYFISHATQNYPWRGPDSPFLGYDHSILQVVYYLMGVTPSAAWVATGIKLLLLLPLGVLVVRILARRYQQFGELFSLELFFAVYTGVFIWMDVVWELSLGIVIFVYLLAVLEMRWEKVLVWIIFLLYAVTDIIQVLSYAILGDSVIVEDAYIITDPSIYIPTVMIVTVLFHFLLMRRLWSTPRLA